MDFQFSNFKLYFLYPSKAIVFEMTFLGRRGNKYRFKVILGISEIKDVPFATGHYFFKIRLLEGILDFIFFYLIKNPLD